MRDPLTVGDTLVATAGTPARIVITGKETAKDGSTNLRIAIIGLNLGLAGMLPVRPTSPTVERLSAGMAIAATTLAAVGFDEGKVRVAAPLPFKLSNDPPNTTYTPAPLRTAAPIINRRKPTSAPPGAPGASPTPANAPSASASPASTQAPTPAAS